MVPQEATFIFYNPSLIPRFAKLALKKLESSTHFEVTYIINII
jgi:hypothetical protein